MNLLHLHNNTIRRHKEAYFKHANASSNNLLGQNDKFLIVLFIIEHMYLISKFFLLYISYL